MPIAIHLILMVSSLCAAGGQMLFKAGATGRQGLVEFVNAQVVGGLFLYGVSTLLWIYGLSKAQLTMVYPYTALTFVLVYASGVLVFGEPAPPRALVGGALILAGLFLMAERAA